MSHANTQDLMRELLADAPHSTLVCLTENVPPADLSDFKGTVLTNRLDVFNELVALDIDSLFNDFDFGAIPQPERYSKIVYRIGKEKAISRHIINSALAWQASEITLHCFGFKNEGINSVLSHLESDQADLDRVKHKKQLLEWIVRRGTVAIPETLVEEYTQFEHFNIDGFEFESKSGLYGWDKVDTGSKLLMEACEKYLSDGGETFDSLLDLGCGYGYLSMRAAPNVQSIRATDNCAAALAACERNLKTTGKDVKVIPSNCADSISESFDLILCNPPFHKGFDHEKQLTESFVKAAASRLNKGGIALFVVNQFIGIEKFTIKHFTNSEILVKKDGFKVILAKHG